MNSGKLTPLPRYLVSGASLFALDLLVVLTLVQLLGIPVPAAQLAGRASGAVTGFFVHRYFTFRTSLYNPRHRTLGQTGGYLSVGLFTLAISPLVLLGFLYLSQGHLVVAKLLTELLLVMISYVSLRFVFRGRCSRDDR